MDSKRRWLTIVTGVLSALAIALIAFAIWGCSTADLEPGGPHPADPSSAKKDIQRAYDRIAPGKVLVDNCKNTGDGLYSCHIEVLADCGALTFEVPRYRAYIRENQDPRELSSDKPLTAPDCPSRR